MRKNRAVDLVKQQASPVMLRSRRTGVVSWYHTMEFEGVTLTAGTEAGLVAQLMGKRRPRRSGR